MPTLRKKKFGQDKGEGETPKGPCLYAEFARLTN